VAVLGKDIEGRGPSSIIIWGAATKAKRNDYGTI